MFSRFRFFLWGFFVLCGGLPALAATSPLVPLHDWTYSAVEKLTVCGLITPGPLTSKPLTRIQMAKLVAEAVDHLQNEDVTFSPLEDVKGLELLMDGLMEEYQSELAKLGVSVAEVPETRTARKRFQIHFPESVRFQKTMAGLGEEHTLLLENNHGWRYHKGFNLRGDAAVHGQWGDWFTIVLSPTLRITKPDTNLLMEQLYAETEWKNLRVTLGRQSFWWGPGYHGALLLSNNAFPFDAFRLASLEPYALPKFFHIPGDWQTDFFVAKLGGEQDRKHPRFSGLRQQWTPIHWLTLGGSHTVIFGGEGARDFDPEDLLGAYFKSESGNINEPENHVASWDWQLTFSRLSQWIPLARGLRVYGEYAFEDAGFDFNLITLKASASYLHGLYLADVFRIRDLDLRLELAQIDSQAYEHFFYRTGYRHKGEFLGYHTGPDSRNFYFLLTKKLTDTLESQEDVTLGAELDLQQSGMERQPYTQTLNEISLFFSRPGPWGFLLKTAFTILQWKNAGNKNSPADTDLLLSLEATRKW